MSTSRTTARLRTAKPVRTGGGERIPPRERLLTVADDLFHRFGIRGVGVEAIAEAAGTNKMTLYRHFGSKDELVTEWLRRVADLDYTLWDQLEAACPCNPRGQLLAWIAGVENWLATSGDRGCLYTNSLAELPEPTHPARAVIEAHKIRQRDRLADLLRQSGVSTPETVADQLFFLAEGAKVSAQGNGMENVAARFGRVARAALAAVPDKAREKPRARKQAKRG
jgi:AcrR family transcriptional regulator